ncbi:MAG: MFS transporter [Dehalococcoidia bacterium]|nr:MFS transporter [Dehalococcoidia bacterium]
MTVAIKTAKSSRYFYGWNIMGVIVVGGFLGAGTSQLFMGVMLKPITEDLGWTRTAMTGGLTAGTVVAGLLSPVFGRLADRFGPRVLMTLGALLVAASYFIMAGLSALWMFYLAYILGRSMASINLGGVVAMTAATNWFRRKRGRALGLVSMALPLGGSVLVFAAQLIIDGPGWRTVFLLFGIAMLAIVVVPAAVILRRRPEDIGLLPDGDTSTTDNGANTGSKRKPSTEYSWTLRQAVGTPTLWILIASASIGVMANGMVSFHQVAYFTDQGLDTKHAALALSVFALAGAVSSGAWGLLVEHFSERYMAVIAMAVAAISMVFLQFVDTTGEAIIFSAFFGISARGESSLIQMMIAQYYGRNSYGSISSLLTPFQMIGLGFGPLIASIFYDVVGSYDMLFLGLSGVYAVTMVLLWLARKPVVPDLKAVVN